jgi:hypothetical protein
MTRARKRADRIRETIPIQRVLADYGYAVEAGYDGEQQFSCDLHGDGQDGKPSARVYPDSASWYCFACDHTRDAVETVREKEGIEFWPALQVLEKRYNLPRLAWDDEDQENYDERKRREIKAVDEVTAALDPQRTYDQDRTRVFKFLDSLTIDRDVAIRTVASMWEAYDKVVYLVFKEQATEAAGRVALLKILERAKTKQKEAFAA